MHISVTFGGALVEFLPEGTSGNTAVMSCIDGISVRHVIEQAGIPETRSVLVILNGDLVQPDDYSQRRLVDGDVLSLVQPIQAG